MFKTSVFLLSGHASFSSLHELNLSNEDVNSNIYCKRKNKGLALLA